MYKRARGMSCETTAAPALVVTAKDWRPRPPVRAGSPPQCVGGGALSVSAKGEKGLMRGQ